MRPGNAPCGIRRPTWGSARAWPSPSCCASGWGTTLDKKFGTEPRYFLVGARGGSGGGVPAFLEDVQDDDGGEEVTFARYAAVVLGAVGALARARPGRCWPTAVAPGRPGRRPAGGGSTRWPPTSSPSGPPAASNNTFMRRRARRDARADDGAAGRGAGGRAGGRTAQAPARLLPARLLRGLPGPGAGRPVASAHAERARDDRPGPSSRRPRTSRPRTSAARPRSRGRAQDGDRRDPHAPRRGPPVLPTSTCSASNVGPTKHMLWFAHRRRHRPRLRPPGHRAATARRVPHGLGAAVETLVVYVRDEIAEKNIGHDGAQVRPAPPELLLLHPGGGAAAA